jgi:ornithine cyclodeaminase/alanine dehydrogenase-like protein (mu-crystallin family)
MTATDAVPFIDEARVRAALATGPLVDAMAEALEAYSTGRAEQPVRSLCALGGRDAVMLTKPAVFGVAAVKVVTLVPENAARGCPPIRRWCWPSTGKPGRRWRCWRALRSPKSAPPPPPPPRRGRC